MTFPGATTLEQVGATRAVTMTVAVRAGRCRLRRDNGCRCPTPGCHSNGFSSAPTTFGANGMWRYWNVVLMECGVNGMWR